MNSERPRVIYTEPCGINAWEPFVNYSFALRYAWETQGWIRFTLGEPCNYLYMTPAILYRALFVYSSNHIGPKRKPHPFYYTVRMSGRMPSNEIAHATADCVIDKVPTNNWLFVDLIYITNISLQIGAKLHDLFSISAQHIDSKLVSV